MPRARRGLTSVSGPGTPPRLPATPTTPVPGDLAAALERLADFRPGPPVQLSAAAGPPRLAPHSKAWTATVDVDGEQVGSGRLVVLHDPSEPDPWGGATRLVAYAHGQVDREMADDPLLVDVGWSWLLDALACAGAEHSAPGGTVTRTASRGFGSLTDDSPKAEIEVRASWTLEGDPLVEALPRHVRAWCDLMRAACGIPPEGISQLHR